MVVDMEAIIIILILLIVLFYYRRFGKFVYAFAIIDILLRILTFLKNNISASSFKTFISKYIPASYPALINKYTNGTINDILTWFYVGMFIIFEFYIIKAFIKNKKL